MKKLVMINMFKSNVASNKYDDVLNINISGLDSNSMIELMYEIYDYIVENRINDVVFIVKNHVYTYLTELLHIINLTKKKLFDTYMVPERYLKNIEKEGLIIEDIMVKIDISKPRLDEFQVHLNDHCNLNCKGCGHFCPIITDANFLDLEKYDQDLGQLNKKFWGVGKIYLLGGEPLLHPQVSEFAAITRKHFPDADIRLYTNGLLLDKQNKEFWEVIKDHSIHIEISLYASTLKIFDKIETTLKENGVWDEAILWNNKQQFSKGGLLHSNGDKENAYNKCSNKICHYLRDGYLALCPGVLLRKAFWKHYGIPPQYDPEANSINLYDENITGWQIMEYFKQPNEACFFCGADQWYDWSTVTLKTAQITDWIIDYPQDVCE